MPDENQTVPHSDSRIFEGYRILGNVSNHVPCLTRYIHRRRKNFIVTCIGKSFNTYASQQLQLISVGGTHAKDITCMAVDTYHVYTASEGIIYAWRRGTELKHTYGIKGQEIVSILPFGPIILGLDAKGTLRIYDIVSEEKSVELKLQPDAHIVMHPATYLNKVLVGFKSGRMQLWNIHSGDLVHTFEGFGTTINAIVQAPAVDVVAVSLPKTKSIALHNLKLDHTLFFLKSDESVTSLNFRTDNVPVLIGGTANGTLIMWDLEKKEITGQVDRAHHKAVTSIQTFPQEPLFVTSSEDNSIKVWIFDMPDGSFRLYNSREGHYQSPQKIRFHGPNGFHILSAGSDSKFLMFHIYNETYNRSLGKVDLTSSKSKMTKDFTRLDEKYIPRITDFTGESVADLNHHSDIAACHENQAAVSTWSFNNTSRGDKVLLLNKYKKCPRIDVSATCIYLTSCGQFVVIGYDDGTVERFNIQSGLHRKTYGDPAHKNSVRGVSVDRVSSVVTTGSSDSFVRTWNFDSGEQLGKISLQAGVSFMFTHKVTGMIGAGLDDNSVVCIDVHGPNVIRRFTDIGATLMCGCFSPDARHVTVAMSDCVVRTWDIPTANMVDAFRLDAIVKSMEYSPNGEYLATAVHNNVGIALWLNKTLFAHISLMPLPRDYEPPLLHVPKPEPEEMETDEDLELLQEYASPDQLSEELITLSLLPESRWKNLLKLDVIKARNKPKEAPKNYEAPFFLSALMAGSAESGLVPSESLAEPDKPASRMLKNTALQSNFLTTLRNDSGIDNKANSVMKILAEMNPTNVDLEFRSLYSEGSTADDLKAFMECLVAVFQSNRYYEAAQAYLALLLKIHGEFLRDEAEFRPLLKDFSSILDKRDTVLQEDVNSILAFSNYIKSTLFL